MSGGKGKRRTMRARALWAGVAVGVTLSCVAIAGGVRADATDPPSAPAPMQAGDTQAPAEAGQPDSFKAFGDAKAQYSPKEIFEKALDANNRADDTLSTTMTIFFAVIGVVVTVFLACVGFLAASYRSINEKYASLRREFEAHVATTKPILSAITSSAALATTVSNWLNIPLLAHMDSPKERAIMEHWIEKANQRIGVEYLEYLANNLDMLHGFEPEVFAHFGHYYRFQASTMTTVDLRSLTYRTALSYYKRAIQKEPKEKEVLSDLHLNTAICYNLLGEYEKCADAADHSIRVRTSAGLAVTPVAHETKGFALMYVGDFAGSERCYEMAAPRSTDPDRLLYNTACMNALWAVDLVAGGDASNADKYEKAMTALERISEPKEFRARAGDDPDLKGLREHVDFAVRFRAWSAEVGGEEDRPPD